MPTKPNKRGLFQGRGKGASLPMPSLIPLLKFYSSFLTFPFNPNNPLFFSPLIFLKTFVVVFVFVFLIGHTMQLVGS